jgi:DNA-binding MarR family transcriptional regulator
MGMAREGVIQEIVENVLFLWRDMIGRRRNTSGGNTISRVQGVVLTIAGHHDGLSIKDVAERMGISGSAATQLVESSVRDGLLLRGVDPRDRRVMRISVTPLGRSKLESFRKARVDTMNELLSGLDNGEIEAFRDLLRKIVRKEGTSPGGGAE